MSDPQQAGTGKAEMEQRHAELIKRGWLARNGIWQPQYSFPLCDVPWIVLDDAYRVHLEMLNYSAAESQLRTANETILQLREDMHLQAMSIPQVAQLQTTISTLTRERDEAIAALGEMSKTCFPHNHAANLPQEKP